MSNKVIDYQIIAFWNEDGKRYFKVGKKIDNDKPLDTDNVEWKLDSKGKPVHADEYEDAYILCYGKPIERYEKEGKKKRGQRRNSSTQNS